MTYQCLFDDSDMVHGARCCAGEADRRVAQAGGEIDRPEGAAEGDASPPPDAGRGTAVKRRPGRPRADRLPPYKVLLHNDDVNEMLYVVESIATLTPHDRTSATKVMIEAHTSGVALLLTTHKERAELYEEQFRSKRLLVTVEPVD